MIEKVYVIQTSSGPRYITAGVVRDPGHRDGDRSGNSDGV